MFEINILNYYVFIMMMIKTKVSPPTHYQSFARRVKLMMINDEEKDSFFSEKYIKKKI